MPKPAPDPAIVEANDKFFEMLIWTYPRRDKAEAAREAFDDVMAAADDAGQLRVCLLDGANRYVDKMRAADQHGFMTLALFIGCDELWRPEYLECNLAQEEAAAKAA